MSHTVRLRRIAVALALAAVGLVPTLTRAGGQTPARPGNVAASDWIQLFNGRDLADWTIKFAKHELGENLHNTFRVEDGLLKIRYDGWPSFNGEFGHIFYKDPFCLLPARRGYRFVGDQVTGAPAWAMRNNGLMLHSPSPRTMLRDQDFPIALEIQLLGGLGKGPRTTANLCTPGSHVVYQGTLHTATLHQLDVDTFTYDGDLGENLRNTFRVEDGLLKVRYDQWPSFNGEFGHIFYKDPFSYYLLAAEYRFVGEQVAGAPGLGRPEQRPDAAQSAPADDAEGSGLPDLPRDPAARRSWHGPAHDGQPLHAGIARGVQRAAPHGALHQLDVADLRRRPVGARGSARPRRRARAPHRRRTDGPRVLEAADRRRQVSPVDPAVKVDGTPMTGGYISLQAETAPIDFRKVELLNLEGCTDPRARELQVLHRQVEPGACAASHALPDHGACIWPSASSLLPASLAAQGGPTDRQKVDDAAATRGRGLYAEHCINCHGSTAKGGPNGPDLIRSTAVLRDRLGSEHRPGDARGGVLASGRADASRRSSTSSHFLRQRVEAVTRNRTPTAPIDVLTGDPEAGRAYFNGAGRCSTCHSPTGDFAGLRSRTPDALTLQQRFLFPTLSRSTKQVEVTVTPPSGPPVSGTLVRIDNFNVSLREASGDYRAFSRVPGVTVEVRDPLAVHRELLDQYTDEAIHDVVAYLWTLK